MFEAEIVCQSLASKQIGYYSIGMKCKYHVTSSCGGLHTITDCHIAGYVCVWRRRRGINHTKAIIQKCSSSSSSSSSAGAARGQQGSGAEGLSLHIHQHKSTIISHDGSISFPSPETHRRPFHRATRRV